MVLEVTAKDDNGKEFYNESKTWFEIGVDTDRDMRYGAWQIKEIIDLTLPPKYTAEEKYLMHFDTDTERIDIEVKLWYYIKGSKGDVIYDFKKTLDFEVD